MTPSKSIPPKSNNDFKEKYPNVRVGTLLVSMRITGILNNNSFFAMRQRFRIRKRHKMIQDLVNSEKCS